MDAAMVGGKRAKDEWEPGGRVWLLRTYVFGLIVEKHAIDGSLLDANLPEFGTADMTFLQSNGQKASVILYGTHADGLTVQIVADGRDIAEFQIWPDDLVGGKIEEKLESYLPGCVASVASSHADSVRRNPLANSDASRTR